MHLNLISLQLIKVAFDPEVKSDDLDALRKLMNRLRGPVSVLNTFAFIGYVLAAPVHGSDDKHREKNASIR